MKIIKQFGIIVTISFIGEFLNYIVPLPIPASIYGLSLMFLALYFHIIKLEDIRKTSLFLVEIMPLMFIPAAVGLLNYWSRIKQRLIGYLIITIITTFSVMIVTGRVTQYFLEKNKRKGN